MQDSEQMEQKGGEDSPDSTSRPPTLEEVLVGFQKSLARATLAAYNVSKSDPDFSRGSRALYVTEGIEVDLRAGLGIASGRPGKQPDRITVDFGAPAETRSSIRFRVGTKPLEYIKGPELVLASLDPVGESTASAHYRLYLVDVDRNPIKQHPVTLRLAPRDVDAEMFSQEFRTDDYGAITFGVERKSGSFIFRGKKFPPTQEPSIEGSVAPAWLLSARATVKERELKSDIYVVLVHPED
jgi:hypothetical protein